MRCIRVWIDNYSNSSMRGAGMTSRSKPRSNDKGAAPRFAMASPSIWCRISLRAAIFSPPLCLSRPLPLYVLSSPTLGTGMMLFLIKTNPGTTDFAAPPPFLIQGYTWRFDLYECTLFISSIFFERIIIAWVGSIRNVAALIMFTLWVIKKKDFL